MVKHNGLSSVLNEKVFEEFKILFFPFDLQMQVRLSGDKSYVANYGRITSTGWFHRFQTFNSFSLKCRQLNRLICRHRKC